jgi:hypothetical protein
MLLGLLQTVWLRTKDGLKLHGWLLKLANWSEEHIKQKPVIMFFQVGMTSQQRQHCCSASSIRSLRSQAFIAGHAGTTLRTRSLLNGAFRAFNMLQWPADGLPPAPPPTCRRTQATWCSGCHT